jgi:hypothetical protein
MAPPWITQIELIANGEPVSAETPNRPLGQLTQRTDFLKALVDVITLGGATIDLNAALDIAVEEGFAVYWNHTTQCYAPALAALDYDNSGLYGGIADSAYVVGVCVSKAAPTRGTIMLSGLADDVEFSVALDGDLVPGPYWLSATDPGHMVKQRPPVGIYCMFGQGPSGSTGGAAIIQPSPREVLEDHIHFVFTLEYGNTVGDPGWTNVYDADLAPVNTRFRYTVEDDARLNDIFPFVPPELAYVEIDGIGNTDKILIDLNGIWWLDDSFDPDDYAMFKIYYAKPTAKTDNSIVTSVQPWTPDGALRVVDCYGEDSTTGDLKIKLELVLEQENEDTPGYLVLKELTDTGQFMRGPVAESIRSVSPEISVLIDGGNGVTDEDGNKAGKLLLRFNNPEGTSQEGMPSLTTLFGAEQADASGIPYVALPPENYASSVGYKFDLNTSGLAGMYDFVFVCWVYAESTGVLPSLTVDWTVVKAPATNANNLATPGDVITGSGTLLYSQSNVVAQDYLNAIFSGIEVGPGDQVHIRISRQDASYPGHVGFLKTMYMITQQP